MQAFKEATTKTLFSPFLGLTEDFLPLDRLRALTRELRHVAGSQEIRIIRERFSYRHLGSSLALVMLCTYVAKKTQKPHYREIAEIMSTLSGKVHTEDTISHRASRAAKRLTRNGRYPQLAETLTDLFTLPASSEIGHKPTKK